MTWICRLETEAKQVCVLHNKGVILGHNLSEEGILPDPDNVAKILNWPVPKIVCDVRGILGLGSYYHQFMRNFSERVQPLVELTKKDKPFKWTEACQEALDDIKQALISPDIMAFPADDGFFILNTDVSDKTISTLLTQTQSGVEKVIAYGSQTLGKAERNYCATDHELLAVKYFMEYYKHYLLGRYFRVWSGHEALKWPFSLKEPKHRIA